MKILIVASYNKGRFAPFIVEQANALKLTGCEIEYIGLQGKGLKGYLKNLPALKRKIKEIHPDVVHAHYGLSGLLANLQRRTPVVTTYHGSDINDNNILRLSQWAMRLSAWNIFVSQKTLEIARPRKKYSLLPCGVDLTALQLTEKCEARQKMGLDAGHKYVLFSGAFDNAVKNVSLAKEVLALSQVNDLELVELKGFTREEVTLLMCAADVLLMTSITEGSPQVIKEAMACGCPIVSVDVGDVRERIEGLAGCYVAETREPQEIVGLLQKALAFEGKILGREKLIADGLDNMTVAKRLEKIYRGVSDK